MKSSHTGRLIVLVLVFVALLTSSLGQKNPHFVKNRTTIVHLFEWKWKDIAEECERFLQHKGYGGIQTSPPSENIIKPNRPWWERYQVISYQLKTRSGDEADFLNMTKRCNAVGVRIYPDVVINHMAASDGRGTAGNIAKDHGYTYPAVPYSREHFNAPCPLDDFNDPYKVRNCDLVGLKDLNQTNPYVRSKIVEYLNHLIDLGVAGFRVDAAKHIPPSDLEAILNALKTLNTEFGFAPGSKPYIFQEVTDSDSKAMSKYEYTKFGAVVDFKYGRSITNVFLGNDKLHWLSNWGPAWGFVNNSEDAVVIVDNHDTQRDSHNSLNHKNAKRYKMANAFMLAHPYGTPKIMSSYGFDNFDQGPPADSNGNIISPAINPDESCGNGYICEHRWRQIYQMVEFRNIVGKNAPVQNWWSNGDQQISFCRGEKGFVAFTNWGDLDQKLQTCLQPGIYCDIISGKLAKGKCTGKTIHVEEDGRAQIKLNGMESDGVIAIHVESKIESFCLTGSL